MGALPGPAIALRARVLYVAPRLTESLQMHGAKLSFQALILRLHEYWSRQDCVILQPYDVEMGAGTFHPATTLRR